MNGGRGEVNILCHRPVTRSDLKQDRFFFRESVSTFLQLVVACFESCVCFVGVGKTKQNKTKKKRADVLFVRKFQIYFEK